MYIDNTQQNVKLFKIQGVLCFLDSPFKDFSSTKFNFKNPISVKDPSRKIIGHANVFVEKNAIMADLIIDYHCPERLDIQNKTPIYLSSTGHFSYKESFEQSLDFYGAPQEVIKVALYSLHLTYKAPLDERIPYLGEPFIL